MILTFLSASFVTVKATHSICYSIFTLEIPFLVENFHHADFQNNMHESSKFHFHTQHLISMCYPEDVQTVVCDFNRFQYILKVVFLGKELKVCIS